MLQLLLEISSNGSLLRMFFPLLCRCETSWFRSLIILLILSTPSLIVHSGITFPPFGILHQLFNSKFWNPPLNRPGRPSPSYLRRAYKYPRPPQEKNLLLFFPMNNNIQRRTILTWAPLFRASEGVMLQG